MSVRCNGVDAAVLQKQTAKKKKGTNKQINKKRRALRKASTFLKASDNGLMMPKRKVINNIKKEKEAGERELVTLSSPKNVTGFSTSSSL